MSIRVPVVPKWRIEADLAEGLSEARARQEYYCDFAGPVESAFYGDEMTKAEEEGRLCKVPWDPNFPTVTAWDLGMMDYTAIWFIQFVNGWHHHIDYYENRGLPFEHYLNEIHAKPYFYTDHIGPHDIKHKQLATGTSCFEVARNFGVHFRVAPKLLIRDGIAAVRSVLLKSRFDEDKCERGIRGLREYRRQRDESNDDYLELAVHDWASHPADAERTYATGRRALNAWSGPSPQTRLAIV